MDCHHWRSAHGSPPLPPQAHRYSWTYTTKTEVFMDLHHKHRGTQGPPPPPLQKHSWTSATSPELFTDLHHHHTGPTQLWVLGTEVSQPLLFLEQDNSTAWESQQSHQTPHACRESAPRKGPMWLSRLSRCHTMRWLHRPQGAEAAVTTRMGGRAPSTPSFPR